MFSKACEYGIRAVIHIAGKSKGGQRESLKSIAKAIDSPSAFTAKILQSLANDNIIRSSRGPGGGYDMTPQMEEEITLLKIVKAVDGDALFKGCGLGLKQCNAEKPCPLHDKFVVIRTELIQMLKSTSLDQITEGLEQGELFLKR